MFQHAGWIVFLFFMFRLKKKVFFAGAKPLSNQSVWMLILKASSNENTNVLDVASHKFVNK